jgi:hypothetical protein
VLSVHTYRHYLFAHVPQSHSMQCACMHSYSHPDTRARYQNHKISGLESEVQCIRQQMHEMRPFPVPDHHKVLQNGFFAWCEVGVCRATCCALSLALAPGSSHEGFGRVDSFPASQLKLRGKAPEPDQTPLMQFTIEV